MNVEEYIATYGSGYYEMSLLDRALLADRRHHLDVVTNL